jgi:hypothetical protein
VCPWSKRTRIYWASAGSSRAAGGKVQDRDDLVARQAIVQLNQFVEGEAVFEFSNTRKPASAFPENPGAAYLFGHAFDGGALRPIQRCHIRSLLQGKGNRALVTNSKGVADNIEIAKIRQARAGEHRVPEGVASLQSAWISAGFRLLFRIYEYPAFCRTALPICTVV